MCVCIQKCTVLAYTPRHPDVYAAVSSTSAGHTPLDATELVVRPVTLLVGLTDKLTASLHTGTSTSIQQLGGIKCFLFLYAKVCIVTVVY